MVMADVVLLQLSKGLRKDVAEAMVARMAGDLMEKLQVKVGIVSKMEDMLREGECRELRGASHEKRAWFRSNR